MDDFDPHVAAAKPDPASRLAHRLADAHCRISASAPTGDQIAFMCSSFVRFTLPHRRQLGHSFERCDGARVITFMSPPSIGLPFGKWPRLLLIYLTTQAVRTRQRDIDLSTSMSSFMKCLGASVTGGATGSIATFKDQLLRTASMSATLSHIAPDTARLQNAPVADEFAVSWNVVGTDGRSGLPARIRLGERIFNEMLTAAVPLDMRSVSAIQQSPLALDLYSWLTFRAHRLRPGSSASIPWADLRKQFGSAYREQSDFKIAFMSALRQVQLVYPALRCAARDAYFVLNYSPTSIAPSAARGAARPA